MTKWTEYHNSTAIDSCTRSNNSSHKRTQFTF